MQHTSGEGCMSSVRVTYLQVSEGRRQLGCPEQVSWKVAQEVVLLLCPPHSDLDAKANSNASSISDSQNLIQGYESGST